MDNKLQQDAGASAPTCSACRFWMRDGEEDRGVCRRRAPLPLAAPRKVSEYTSNDDEHYIETEITSAWPDTQPGDWCGEYEPNNVVRGAALGPRTSPPTGSATGEHT